MMAFPVKTLVWGFADEFAPAIHLLKGDGTLEVRVWIGPNAHCTHSRKTFMERDLHFSYPAVEKCPEGIREAVFRHFWQYLDMIAKYNKSHRWDVHDYLDYFNRQLDYYHHLLKTEGIELLLMDRIPHYGTDFLLYQAAKAMGIHTIVLFPSIFGGYQYFVYDCDDYGRFTMNPVITERPDIKVERRFEKTLHYMKYSKPPQYRLLDAIREAWKERSLWPFNRYRRFRDYQKNLESMATQDVRMDVPFVYFPLHIQPEVTTSAMGDQFCDQALALEALAAMLPSGWLIYVKENPAQTEFMRGPGFFSRLKAIPNLRMVSSETNTYTLIEKCRFVATITGTAGWEAITGGKPVLVFGRPWYLTFPGVVSYREGLRVEDVTNCLFAHEEIESAVADLLSRSGRGYMARGYHDLSGFDPEQNGQLLAGSIRAMIEHAPWFVRQPVSYA